MTRKAHKIMKEQVYNILNKYVDLEKKETYKNRNGINVERYFDGMDLRNYYVPELLKIGFKNTKDDEYQDEYQTVLWNKKFLCCIAYVERDLLVVWYRNNKEYEKEYEYD